VPYEILDAAEIRRRVPAWQVDDSIHALFQADGGIVAAERATAAHQRIARSRGAVLLEKTPVTAIEASNGAVNVEAGGRRYHARHLIVAAGPWSGPVLQRFGVRLPLEVTKEQAMYFAPADTTAFAFREFPVWIWMDDPSFYGFPVFGESARSRLRRTPADERSIRTRAGSTPIRHHAARARIHSQVFAFRARSRTRRQNVPLHAHAGSRLRHRLAAEHPNVHVAIGAGHAFKFASVIGRILSDLALDGSRKAQSTPSRSIVTFCKWKRRPRPTWSRIARASSYLVSGRPSG